MITDKGFSKKVVISLKAFFVRGKSFRVQKRLKNSLQSAAWSKKIKAFNIQTIGQDYA